MESTYHLVFGIELSLKLSLIRLYCCRSSRYSQILERYGTEIMGVTSSHSPFTLNLIDVPGGLMLSKLLQYYGSIHRTKTTYIVDFGNAHSDYKCEFMHFCP